jgi:hypothetical protein
VPWPRRDDLIHTLRSPVLLAVLRRVKGGRGDGEIKIKTATNAARKKWKKEWGKRAI